MSENGGIVIREADGFLDTPWGSQLRDIESRVHEADRESVLARWESGKHILKRREGRKQLPAGLIDEIAAKLDISKREIRYRMKFADVCSTEDEVCNALQTYGSWREIIKNLLTRSRSGSQSGDSRAHLFIRRARKQLPEVHAQDLSDSDLDALRQIMDEIERIFSEVQA